jgi:hypothetical protein
MAIPATNQFHQDIPKIVILFNAEAQRKYIYNYELKITILTLVIRFNCTYRFCC